MGKSENYSINNYRYRKLGKEYLVTTDHGDWIFLDSDEFNKLKNEEISEALFHKLEEKGIILTDKNKEKIIDKLREKYGFLLNRTSLHIIVPTLRCNEKCVYCHASSRSLNSKGYDMENSTAKAVVDFIFQSPSQNLIIEFQGGEPLIRFDIIKSIIEYSKEKKHKKKLNFTIVSNLSLIDDLKISYLIENNVSICTSLDGPQELHNKNRGILGKIGSHELTKKGIIKINKEYEKRNIDKKVNALVTITKESLKYHKEIIDEYRSLGIGIIHLRFLNDLGRAKKVEDSIGYSAEEFIEFWKRSIDYIIELNKKGEIFQERICNIILTKIILGTEPNYLEMRSPCGAVIGQMTYDQKGDIYTCDQARMIDEEIFNLGNVKKHKYKEIISSKKSCAIISSSINDNYSCDYCVYKPYCGTCPVCNYSEQGNIIAKIPESFRCKIYKEQFTYIFEKLKDPEIKKILLNWIKDGEKNQFSED